MKVRWQIVKRVTSIWRKKCAATNLGDSLVGAINVGLGRNTVSKKVISVLDRPA